MEKNIKPKDIVLIALAVALLAVCSWISIPAGAVPVTLQTMAVFTAVGLLGWKKASISIILYLFMGAVGLPVFANFTGGFSRLIGVTGGYLVGFIFSSLLSGYILNRTEGTYLSIFLAFSAGLIVCYAFGSIWFYLVYLSSTGPISFAYIISVCVIPFIIPDLVKISLSTVITVRLKKHLSSAFS